MLFENSLAERGLELLEVLSRNIVLNDPNWALDARAVSKFIPGVVLVEDFENPLSFDCLRVVGRTRHLELSSLRVGDTALVVWHVVAPGTVALL